MPEPCPFCDLELANDLALADHLARDHSGVELGRGYFYRLTINHRGTVKCWCGQWFRSGVKPEFLELPDTRRDRGVSKFARHLRDQGGAVAHALEVALGLYPPGKAN